MTTAETNLAAVNHIVVLMLENRSFDHMLGYLYAGSGNVSPSGQPFEGLTGKESCPDSNGNPVINDNGVIAGGFFDVAGVEHGFIATCSGNGC